MTTAIKSLNEMTTGELTYLKHEVAQAISDAIRNGAPTEGLTRFESKIDNELDRRGA